MKSIYESVRNIIEGNYTGKNVPRSNFNRVRIAPQQGGIDPESNTVKPVEIFPSAAGRSAQGGTGILSKIKSSFSRAADLEKSLTANPPPVYRNTPAAPKQTSNELPSVTTSKVMGTTTYTSPPPVVTKGPTGSEKIPADAAVPAYIRQNKPEPVMTDKPSASQKAKDLMDKMDQMQQQGIGQTKPKVSSDFYKNLKGIGMKQSNESRMGSAYATIRRILGERSYTYDQLKEYQDKRDIAVQDQEKKDLAAIQAELKKGRTLDPKVQKRYDELTAKNKSEKSKSQANMTDSQNAPKVGEYIDIKNKPQVDKMSPITPGSLGKRIDVTRVDLEKDNSRGSQTKYLADKGLKGNEAMKKQEADAAKKAADAAKKAATVKPIASTIPANNNNPPASAPAQSAVAPLPKTTVSREAETSGPDLNAMKKDIASNQKYDKPIDTVTATKDNADSEKPVEAPTEKSQASTEAPKPSTADDYKTGDYRRFDPKAPMRGEFSRVNNNQNDKSQTPETPAAAAPPQAAMTPSSSEFKFSADQEKWLGKANRQDPYILNRMPGDKPPVDYYKDPKDQELAKKINTGNETVKKIKGAIGMKESTINKKFDITDALYQSVMEVMKKDKKEGSVPRNSEEEKLAAFHGDPKRITHGDVLKARGVTKEEVDEVDEALVGNQHKIDANKNNKIDAHDFKLLRAKKKTNESVDKGGKLEIEDRKKLEMDKKNSPENNEKGMTRGTRPRTASPGFGKDDYKPLIPDTEKSGSARVSPYGTTVKADPKGKMKPSSGDPEGVKESKDTPGNGYAHQCAIHVKSESFGEGRTITTQHADPDAEGNIEWYDVMFEHGIERYVPTSTLEILVSEMHMHSKKKKKMM